MRTIRRRPRMADAAIPSPLNWRAISVEAPLVLTVASRDQARRENRCRPQSLHVRYANSQGVTA